MRGSSDVSTVGKRIATARKARGWSQQTLSDKIAVGRSTVANWETDKVIPEAPSLLTMADKLNVNPYWILLLDENPAPYVRIDPDEAAVLNGFRNLSQVGKEALKAYMGYLASQEPETFPTPSQPFPKARSRSS